MKHIELFVNWYYVDAIIFVSELRQTKHFTLSGPSDPFYFFYLSTNTQGQTLERKINSNGELTNEEVNSLHSKIINFIKSQK